MTAGNKLWTGDPRFEFGYVRLNPDCGCDQDDRLERRFRRDALDPQFEKLGPLSADVRGGIGRLIEAQLGLSRSVEDRRGKAQEQCQFDQ